MTYDSRGRPVIEVLFAGAGPFPMVVDTAAQASFVTSGLAQDAMLPPSGETIWINGAAGRAEVGLFIVERFLSPLFDATEVVLPALPNVGVTEARGIVGMEWFAEGRLIFDNAAGLLSYGPSGEAPEGFDTIVGDVGADGLLRVPVEIDGVVFDALVDTGAAVTVADAAGLRALGWTDEDPRLRFAGQITGATLHGTAARFGQVEQIRLGSFSVRDVSIVFIGSNGETGDRPTLLLGSDLLKTLSRYAVDFPRAELQIQRLAASGGESE